ncbi:acyl-CoA dehydrogenase family protein [uncultured Sphingomonas sp.]|uniref:acyl-CoA dehydrogenase family protein n=1 Tax=uncultured Sphingomonas sp. TaxID=158754 RepID=UPI0025FE0925|nr:acyl-CoA dehydrogenase family protein [uncultured Sphingomonas sp.]
MDFNLSDMQRMLLDSAERLVGNRYTLEHRRALRDQHDGFDADAWASFAELGWLALAVPEEKGGLGGSIEDVAVLMTAVGSRLVVDPLVSNAVIAPAILSHAPEGDLLGDIASGQRRVALAHDEPGERYGRGPRITRLVRHGNGFTLTGQKMLVLDAVSADMLIVSASVDGEDGTALVLVDAKARAIVSEPYPLIDGAQAADIRFEGVSVTPDAIIVSPESGSAVLAEALDRAKIALMAQAVGSMEVTLAICAAYLKERQQFGQPIGKFQALQHIMADMFVAAHQARSALYLALGSATAAPAQRMRAVSHAAIIVGEASQFVSRNGVQLHGGYGVTDEYEVSHHYRRLLTLEKSYGDIDFHIRRIASLESE